MTLTPRLAALLVVTLAACSSTVTGPATNDAATDVAADAPIDAPVDVVDDAPLDYCILPDGNRCPRGASCPAGDGCNTCSCYGPGPTAACTLIGCIVPDAGTRCRTAADCGRGEFCNYPTTGCAAAGTCQAAVPCAEPNEFCGCSGTSYLACAADRPTSTPGACERPDAGPAHACRSSADCTGGSICQYLSPACGGMGICGFPRDCAFITEYCGCDGQTFRDCPGGITSTPYRLVGPCPGVDDGGVAPACNGAHIGRDGRSCVGLADEPLSVDCCTWNCDLRTASCESLPPRCPAGQVNTVAGACWGPCVSPASCAPIRCEPSTGCAAPWRCDPTRGVCVYGG